MEFGCQSMVLPIKRICMKHPRQAFLSQENLERNWKRFGYWSCPDFEEALREYREFERILRENVEELIFLEADPGSGIDSIYAHDPLKVTSRGAILMNMGKELRRPETRAYRKTLEDADIPVLGEIQNPGTMEGGDVLWLDEKTVALGRGYRTNDEGIRQFVEMTGDFIDRHIVVQMPHGGGPDECLHLMSVISLVADDIAVVYSPFMPVSFREFLVERGVTLIEVPADEYDRLGCNVLALSPGKCLMLNGNPVTKSRLEEAGVEVIEYSGRNISLLGTGGPTCLTAPVLRGAAILPF